MSLKITTKTGELNFTKKENQFKVNRCPVVSRESNRETVLLDLTTRNEKTNDSVPIFDKYKGKISDTVKKILSEKLKVSQDRIEVDPTENEYNFVGKGKGALTIIRELCRRSIPVGGDAGYFFYQTKSAFKYKAIDELIKQEPKTKDIIINVPFRSTKSLIVTVMFPVWARIKSPKLRFITSS